jgi:hypothetical protein
MTQARTRAGGHDPRRQARAGPRRRRSVTVTCGRLGLRSQAAMHLPQAESAGGDSESDTVTLALAVPAQLKYSDRRHGRARVPGAAGSQWHGGSGIQLESKFASG